MRLELTVAGAFSSPVNETSPLISSSTNHAYHVRSFRYSHRYTTYTLTYPKLPNSHLIQDELPGPNGERPTPTVVESLRALIFSGYVNVLLVAVPLSFVSHFAGWGTYYMMLRG